MYQAMLQFIHEFISDESGQASNEYTNTLAFTALTFVLIIAIIMAIQNGFVKVLADAMAGRMNEMASKAHTGTTY